MEPYQEPINDLMEHIKGNWPALEACKVLMVQHASRGWLEDTDRQARVLNVAPSDREAKNVRENILARTGGQKRKGKGECKTKINGEKKKEEEVHKAEASAENPLPFTTLSRLGMLQTADKEYTALRKKVDILRQQALLLRDLNGIRVSDFADVIADLSALADGKTSESGRNSASNAASTVSKAKMLDSPKGVAEAMVAASKIR